MSLGGENFIQVGSNKQKMKVGAFHLVIDDKAQKQHENMNDLKSGQPPLEKAVAELTKIELNPQRWPKNFPI
jgi:hypothetical protein